MSTIVSVVFDRINEYELVAHAGMSREDANQWLNAQWEELECESTNPMGKVLVLDKLLGIAEYGGEKRFAQKGEWAQQYANAAGAVMGRPAVRIDIADRVVG